MELIRLLKKDKKRLATAIGIEPSTIYRWLAGETSPTFDDLCAIIRVCTTDEPSEIIAFFEDLKSDVPQKSSEVAINYIRGIRSIRMWKEAFKCQP